VVDADNIDFERIKKRMRRGLLDAVEIHSERIVSLLDSVWNRLPKEDRRILREMIFSVTDESDRREAIGFAAPIDGCLLIDGLESILPTGLKVNLNPDHMSGLSDSAASAVIAHELAHIILRHNCMLSSLSSADEQIVEKVKDVYEWAADHQAWLWGFAAELHQLWQENEMDPPPWYHQIEPETLRPTIIAPETLT